MNDGIDPEMWSLQYTLVEKVARVAQRLGKDTLLAKVDIQAAYCLVPIHPDNCPLLRVGGVMLAILTGCFYHIWLTFCS